MKTSILKGLLFLLLCCFNNVSHSSSLTVGESGAGASDQQPPLQENLNGEKVLADNGKWIEITPPSPMIFSAAKGMSLSTLFGQNNLHFGNMFDIEVLAEQDIVITSFDVNIGNGTTEILVYIKEGTYVGFETNPGAWTLAGSQTNVTGLGINNPTPVSVGNIVLEAGKTYGLYITANHSHGVHMYYTDGSTVYSDDNLKLTTGAGIGSSSGHFQVVNSPRIWNGTIYYDYYYPPAVPVSEKAVYIVVFLILLFIAWRFLFKRKTSHTQ